MRLIATVGLLLIGAPLFAQAPAEPGQAGGLSTPAIGIVTATGSLTQIASARLRLEDRGWIVEIALENKDDDAVTWVELLWLVYNAEGRRTTSQRLPDVRCARRGDLLQAFVSTNSTDYSSTFPASADGTSFTTFGIPGTSLPGSLGSAAVTEPNTASFPTVRTSKGNCLPRK